ncbi:MAG: ABC transporter substrate-binding protein [Cytophagales bacterium]
MKPSAIALFLIFFLWACNSTKNESEEVAVNQLVQTKGGRYYGGIFNLNETEYVKSLYPPSIKDVVSARVASLAYEGLFKFNQSNLEIEPCLVSDFSIDSTGKVYSFALKDSVFFHDDPVFDGGVGRLLNSEDIRFCIENLLTKNSYNTGSSILLGTIKGSEDFFQNSENQDFSGTLEGIKVIDDKHFQITLEKPDVLFLQKLARQELFIYPPEAFHKYGLGLAKHIVGTGAFYLSKANEGSSFVFNKNPKYHGKDAYGNKLPFLNQVEVSFIQNKKSELQLFLDGNLDMVYRLNKDYFKEVLEDRYEMSGGDFSKYQLQQSPEMMTHFLGFNNKNEIYKNQDLRKAISFAVDREDILDLALQGEAYAPGNFGITPPCFENYKNETLIGYKFNKDSAQYYFNKSGFKDVLTSRPITLWLNSDGSRNTHIAVAVKNQLKKVLNIDIKLEIVPLAVLQEKIIDGTAGFYKIAWVADVPSPKSFLTLFYGKHLNGGEVYPNFTRFENNAFDQLYELASQSVDLKKANELFLSAERIIIQSSPVIVLWYDEGYRLLQPYIKNFPNNPMQYRNFSEVYFVKPETLERSKL